MIFHPACDCMGEFRGLSITSLVATMESIASPNTPRVAVLLLEGVAHFHHLRLQSLHKNIYEWSILAAAGAATTTTTTMPTAYYAYHYDYDYDYDTTTTRLPLGDYDYDYDCWVRGREEHYKVITLRSIKRSWWNSLPLKLRCQVFWHPLTTGKWTCIEDVNFSKMREFSSSMANQRARSSYSC